MVITPLSPGEINIFGLPTDNVGPGNFFVSEKIRVGDLAVWLN